MGEFSGKVVAITGAGSGIGRSTALLFGRLGAKVHVSDRNGQAVETVRGELEAGGAAAVAHVTDVSDAAAVEAFATAIYEQDSGVDVLHNNAGIGHGGAIEETTLEDWRRVIEVNLMGVVHGVHFFVPRMLAQGRPAHVVNTASLAGLVANPELAPYCTSKFAVVGLTESLDAELGPRGIHFSALCPGIIATDIVNTATYRGELGASSGWIQDFYANRGASPDVVAKAVVDAVRKRKLIQPTPRSHVSPPWLVKRISPRASGALGRMTLKFAKRH